MRYVQTSNHFPDRFQNRSRRAVQPEAYKDAVIQDIAILLSSSIHLPVESIDDAFPYVKRSVLTYGMPSLVGSTASEMSEKIKDDLRRTLLTFEPRITPETLAITIVEMKANTTVVFGIHGELKVPDSRDTLNLAVSINLDTGKIGVKDTLNQDGKI